MTVYQGTSFTPRLTRAGYALVRAGVKVSAGTVSDLAGSLRRRHERNETRWRLLDPVAQAVLVIAFLRTNLTYAELAAGFGISQATCWRDIREGIGVLADRGRRISLADVALRWPVEEGFEFGKDCFGLDQCQARLYTAILRHVVLVMAALAICAVTAALLRTCTDTQAPPPSAPGQPPPADPGMIPLTVPEIRRILAALTARPLPPPLIIHWDAWTRSHQARARWFHQRARLKRDYVLVS